LIFNFAVASTIVHLYNALCFTISYNKTKISQILRKNFIPFLFSYSCRKIVNIFINILDRCWGWVEGWEVNWGWRQVLSLLGLIWWIGGRQNKFGRKNKLGHFRLCRLST